MPSVAPTSLAERQSARWACTAPFGSEVVPEVKVTVAASAGATRAVSTSGHASPSAPPGAARVRTASSGSSPSQTTRRSAGSTASNTGAGARPASGAISWSAAPCPWRRNRRTAISSATSALRRQCPISRGRASVLSGTRTPPHRQTPNAVASHSARFGMRRPTRVPRPTPSAASPRPIATESSRSSAYVRRRRTLMNASLAGCRAATASSSAGRVWRAVAPLIEVVSSVHDPCGEPGCRAAGTTAVDRDPSTSGALRNALIEDDRLRFQVGMHPFGAALPSDSRLLEAAERDAEVRLEGVVADGSRAESPGDRIGAFRVVREHGGVQAVDRVVRDLDRLLLALRRNDGEHRAEYLLARDGRAVVDVPEHGRLDEVAAIEMRGPTATAREARPLLASHGDVRFHTIALARHRQRSHLGRCIERVSHFHHAESPGERIDERLMPPLA